MDAVIWLVVQIVNIVILLLIVNAVLSWLVMFEVVSPRNRLVGTIYDATSRLTNPLLAPLRRVIPPVGGLDLSPLVLILGLGFIIQLLYGLT